MKCTIHFNCFGVDRAKTASFGPPCIFYGTIHTLYTHRIHTWWSREKRPGSRGNGGGPGSIIEGPRPFLVGSTAQEFRALCSSCLCANYRLARKSSKSNCGLNGLLPMYLHEGSLLVEGGSEYDSGLEGDHPLKVVRKNFYVRIFNRKTIKVYGFGLQAKFCM